MKKLALIILCLLSFTACDTFNFTKNSSANLSEVDEALAIYDLIQAEKILDRILKEETDPAIRYQAYLKIIEISKSLYSDERWAIEYLEAMFAEFKQKDELKFILSSLATQYEIIGDNANANINWFRLIDEAELSDLELANVYNHISRSYYLSSQFNLAEDMALSCLNLTQDSNILDECAYTLSQIKSVQGKLSESIDILSKIYDNPKLNPELKARVALNLADGLEESGQNSQALNIYKDILDEYPNRKLIELRIKNLETK